MRRRILQDNYYGTMVLWYYEEELPKRKLKLMPLTPLSCFLLCILSYDSPSPLLSAMKLVLFQCFPSNFSSLAWSNIHWWKGGKNLRTSISICEQEMTCQEKRHSSTKVDWQTTWNLTGRVCQEGMEDHYSLISRIVDDAPTTLRAFTDMLWNRGSQMLMDSEGKEDCSGET